MTQRKRLFRVRENQPQPARCEKLVLPDPEPSLAATSHAKPLRSYDTTDSLKQTSFGQSKLRMKIKSEKVAAVKVDEQPAKPNLGVSKKVPPKQVPKKQPPVLKQQPDGQLVLVQCKEGCGRKFAPAALQKHEKACKVVFQSRRKQFNTQQQRVISKEQAEIIKQTQRKEKKGKLNPEARKEDKDRWKKQSQEFREVVKNVREAETEALGESRRCPNCGEIFNQLFLGKHQEGCLPARRKK